MIINGGGRGSVGFWSKHLTNEETNDRATLIETRGLLAEDLPSGLREMEAIADQSRSRGNFMYVADINPRDNERLTPEQWAEAVDTLERNLGMQDHQRIVIEHEKAGRVHRHIVWNRVDVDTLKVVDIGGNYHTHQRTARELEQKLGLEKTQSLHGERRPEGRPDRAPELVDYKIAERAKLDPIQFRAELTELWGQTDSGKAFAAGLKEKGLILARGDRRDFVVIDQAGGIHSLARRIEGVKAKDVREKLADLDPAELPSVTQARGQQFERKPSAIEQTVAELVSASDNGPAFVAAMQDKGLYLALATAEDVAKLSHEHQVSFAGVSGGPNPFSLGARTAEAPTVSNRALRVQEGDLVAITPRGDVQALRAHNVDLARVVGLWSIGAEEGFNQLRSVAEVRAEAQHDRATVAEHRAEIRAEAQTRRDQRATETGDDRSRTLGTPEAPDLASGIRKGAGGVIMVLDGMTGIVSRMVEFVDGMLMGTPRARVASPQSETVISQRRALAALGRISESIKNDRPLAANDVRSLTPTHLENIRNSGDEYLRNLVSRMEADRQREQDRDRYGYERER